MLRILSLVLILLPTLSSAQTYPGFKSVYVNDYANIIDTDAEKRLHDQLEALFKEHGVEATILTIGSRKTYGDSSSIESFATGLFNHWGIGNATRNDGILILVAHDDREMRVELGDGYAGEFDFAAGDVIDQDFLPAFRNDVYSLGIEKGTGEVIRRIALPLAGGLDMPEGPKEKGWDVGMIGFFVIVMVFLWVAFRRAVGDLFARLRSCPNCGRKGLHREREVLHSASTTSAGDGELTTTCEYCDYKDIKTYIISRRSSSRSSSRSSFGGGSSSGGGASGRW